MTYTVRYRRLYYGGQPLRTSLHVWTSFLDREVGFVNKTMDGWNCVITVTDDKNLLTLIQGDPWHFHVNLKVFVPEVLLVRQNECIEQATSSQ